MALDRYGNRLTATPEAAVAYDDALLQVLRLGTGAAARLARAAALDPTFALAHADLALLGHELGEPVDVTARLAAATRHAPRSTGRERSHVRAVCAYVAGDATPLVRHLDRWPRDAMLLSAAVPTIAFSGVPRAQADTAALLERAAPAYGDDWWCTGLLAFVRQEQGRYEEAMRLSCRSLATEPAAGHSAHARAHAHYETGDHGAGLAWIDAWVRGDGAGADTLVHFCWHAALHELSLGDLGAVRERYAAQLRPARDRRCRTLVDSGSLLFRWALTPGAGSVPAMAEVAEAVGRDRLERPDTPFLSLHAAVVLLALGDGDGLALLAAHTEAHRDPVQRHVAAPLVRAFARLAAGHASAGADALAALDGRLVELGGSAAQREVVEEARVAALVRAGRYDEARRVLDRRLDRRPAPRDEAWRGTIRRPRSSRP